MGGQGRGESKKIEELWNKKAKTMAEMRRIAKDRRS